MSNIVTIRRRKLVDRRPDGSDGAISYGVFVFDNEDNTYSNLLREDEWNNMSPHDLIDYARAMDSRAAAMIEFAEENGDAIEVDGEMILVNGPTP